MALIGLVAKAALDTTDIDQARDLQAVCEKADGFRVKFNWEMMADRSPDCANDFCYYDNGRLVGYAPLDGFGALYEITAAVSPAFRGRGIFRQLFAAARDEAERRRARRVLLVAYRAASESAARPTRCGLPYRVSEYRMEAAITATPPVTSTDLTLLDVTSAHVVELSHLMAVAFGVENTREPDQLLDEITDSNIKYHLAFRGEAAIGQIGVVMTEKEVYIRGFGILPEYRGRGYGRQLLAGVVRKMYLLGNRHFSLDVETENANALALYQSCGFQEATIYDYYTVT